MTTIMSRMMLNITPHGTPNIKSIMAPHIISSIMRNINPHDTFDRMFDMIIDVMFDRLIL